MNDPPDRRTAERLLRGDAAAHPALAEMLAGAAGPARPAELAGEDAAVAAFRTRREPRPRIQHRTLTRLLTVKALLAVLALGGGAALAGGSGHLPGHQGPHPGPRPPRIGTPPDESSDRATLPAVPSPPSPPSPSQGRHASSPGPRNPTHRPSKPSKRKKNGKPERAEKSKKRKKAKKARKPKSRHGGPNRSPAGRARR
ncbi:hypothetical protein [Actinomadura xylanilytica]|uniref:hypothetical protein n=1 Tax=Actinomadura xylanilytica TaxID=887459 RepID=UPI00255AF741|nr:hypothetical protein [Actinomadura xylanilytica]MDL4773562.1 hypothetical protein [Actinomadura xylanilytica]